jgi:hypothetical protein
VHAWDRIPVRSKTSGKIIYKRVWNPWTQGVSAVHHDEPRLKRRQGPYYMHQSTLLDVEFDGLWDPRISLLGHEEATEKMNSGFWDYIAAECGSMPSIVTLSMGRHTDPAL